MCMQDIADWSAQTELLDHTGSSIVLHIHAVLCYPNKKSINTPVPFQDTALDYISRILPLLWDSYHENVPCLLHRA